MRSLWYDLPQLAAARVCPHCHFGEVLPLGFYIRTGFNFGPIRLNLSRSGLGASIGVKGARIGMGPRGTYVHLGRGGLYYRQTIAPPGEQPFQNPPATTDELPEISSSAAQNIVDSSADQLLQELNRIKRRFDLFPLSIIVGSVLLICVAISETEWWVRYRLHQHHRQVQCRASVREFGEHANFVDCCDGWCWSSSQLG